MFILKLLFAESLKIRVTICLKEETRMPLSELILTGSGATERRKDDLAIRLLREYEGLALERNPRGYAVGFSGGKDSLVVRQLCKEAGVKHFCLYNVTGLDPPELVYFKRRKFAEYESGGTYCRDIMYEKNIMQLMQMKNMPPTRLVRYCCEHLKERTPVEYLGTVFSFGVRQMESNSRMKHRDEMEVYRQRTTQKFAYDNHENRRNFEVCHASNPSGQIRINPIARGWSDGDVWDFIRDRKLEYCSLYNEGFTRLGCVGCPMAGKKRVMGIRALAWNGANLAARLRSHVGGTAPAKGGRKAIYHRFSVRGRMLGLVDGANT